MDTDNDDDRQTLARHEITTGQLPQIREDTSDLARTAGLDEDRAERFALAVHELAANSIEHAGGSGELTVVQDDATRLYAEVVDRGPGMTPPKPVVAPPPDAVRGRGLWLSQELTDHMHIDSGPDGTMIRLEMDLDGQAEPAGDDPGQ